MVDNAAEMMMIHRKVEECTAFLKSTLRPDYQRACVQADAVRTELDDYRQLQQQLWREEQQVDQEKEEEPTKNATADPTRTNISSKNSSSLVDLGFGVLSCEAVVVVVPPPPNINVKNNNKKNDDDQNQQQQPNEARSIFVHVGMGFHVELRHEEAQQAIQRRLQHLHGVWQTRQTAADAIRDHIVSTEQILDELSRLKNISF
jgi:Prefoldin subunit